MLSFLATSIATLGVGRIPKAPGTWGSALALLIWWAVMPMDLFTQLLATVFAFFIGWLATHYYEKWNNKHDPKEVVVDELVGMWIVLAVAQMGATCPPVWIPVGPGPSQSFVFGLSFLMFRFFDILKPPPIGWADRKVPGAFGTMLDDVIAGLFGAIVVYLILRLGWSCSAPDIEHFN